MPTPEVEVAGGGAFLWDPPSDIFIPEQFDADSRLMLDTAKQFVRGEVMPHLERLDSQEPGLMERIFSELGALGLAGIETPEKYGGLGLDRRLGTRILEMLSPNGSFSTTIAVHVGIGQAPISLWGSEEQKRRYLPKLASGEWMGAYALSEPNSGSDALGMSARAVRDGSHFLLTGTKMWISNAKWAGMFITFAKTEGDRVTAFLIERDFSGVSIGPEEHKTGLKGSSTARLVLDSARVPAENVLFREGEGHRVAFNALNLGRLKLGSMSLGPAREAIRQAAKYAKDRKQFGRPIAEFGLIRDKFARMGALIFAGESALYRAADLVEGGFALVDPSAPDLADENRKAAELYAIECSICKVLTTEMLAYCADEAIQIHGGYGFTEEFPVARIWRDARVTRIYEGTNEINRVFIFDRILKKGLLERLLQAKPQSVAHGLLQGAAQTAWSTLGQDLASNQQVLGALSDLAIIHFAQQSAELRAERMAAMGDANADFARAACATYASMSNAQAAAKACEVFSRCGSSREISIPCPDWTGDEPVASCLLDANGYPIG
jgi:alkylation response protein AidB-like acyl-CoA dehydrogenase